MAKKKPSALTALEKVNAERAALEERAAEIRRAAALELGLAALDAGGAALGVDRLRSIVKEALTSRSTAGPGKASKAPASTSDQVQIPSAMEAGNG